LTFPEVFFREDEAFEDAFFEAFFLDVFETVLLGLLFLDVFFEAFFLEVSFPKTGKESRITRTRSKIFFANRCVTSSALLFFAIWVFPHFNSTNPFILFMPF
tara:strand:- start:1898 stop:2203 length:306 start_codon:yes stop_codon:yes gene_type:complete